MAKAAQLNVDILAVADQALATFDKVKEKVTGNHAAMKVAAVAGATAILGAMGEATKAASEHEVAVAKLQTAYKNAGVPMSGMNDSLEEIDASSRRTGQSAEDNIDAYTRLVAATHDSTKAHEELATAQDLAAFKGISVADASTAIIKATGGSTRALKEMGIATTDASGKQLDAQAVMEKLTAAVHGQADAFGGTAAGQMARYKETVEQAKVSMGEALLPAIQKVLAMLQPLFSWLSSNTAILRVLAPIVVILAGAILGVVAAVRVWTAVQAALDVVLNANPIGLLIAAIAALVVGVVLAYQHFGPFRSAIQDVFSWITRLGGWILSNWKIVVDVLLGPLGLIITNFSTLWGWIQDVINALETVGRKASEALGWLNKIPGKGLLDKINPFSSAAPPGAATTPSTIVFQITATPGSDLPEVVYDALRRYQRRHVRPELISAFGAGGW